MDQTIQVDDREYDFENLSEEAKARLSSIQFIDVQIHELKNMQAILRRAQNSYIESIKQEVISNKAGFFLEDE
jgi:hypothetical protein